MNREPTLVFSNRLRAARVQLKLSQGELASMVGVSRQTICSVETGQFCPSAKLALLLCTALEKDFCDLFYFNTAEVGTNLVAARAN